MPDARNVQREGNESSGQVGERGVPIGVRDGGGQLRGDEGLSEK